MKKKMSRMTLIFVDRNDTVDRSSSRSSRSKRDRCAAVDIALEPAKCWQALY